MDEGYVAPQTVPLQVYIDAQFNAHQKVHEAENARVSEALRTHERLHEAEVKASEGMRSTTRWAVEAMPKLVLTLIALVYFILYVARGGH